MTADDFTEAARAEAERRNPPIDRHPDDRTYPRAALREHKRGAFVAGAVWGREQALAQEPTDAEVYAAAQELASAAALIVAAGPKPWEWWTDRNQARFRNAARAALIRARAARRDEATR